MNFALFSALTVGATLLSGCSPTPSHMGTTEDTAFGALQARGETAMGVNQYASSHKFESLPNGGRIELQRDMDDSAGTAAIRAHMADIAGRFAAGDFAIPGFVHAMGAVPGTDTMRILRSQIRYEARALPRGAELRITTTNPSAVRAVHEFLAFQRTDHRTGH